MYSFWQAPALVTFHKTSTKMAPLLRRRRIALCLKASALAVAGASAASSCVVSAFGTSPAVPKCGSISSPASASASSSSVSSPRHSSPRSRSSSRGAIIIHHPSQRRITRLLASTEEDLASTSAASSSSPLSPASLVEENNNSNTNVDSTSLALGGLQERLFLGIEPTPEILAIMTIYFVEGALGLARLAQTFLLKDTLHLGPAEMAALTGLFTLPW